MLGNTVLTVNISTRNNCLLKEEKPELRLWNKNLSAPFTLGYCHSPVTTTPPAPALPRLSWGRSRRISRLRPQATWPARVWQGPGTRRDEWDWLVSPTPFHTDTLTHREAGKEADTSHLCLIQRKTQSPENMPLSHRGEMFSREVSLWSDTAIMLFKLKKKRTKQNKKRRAVIWWKGHQNQTWIQRFFLKYCQILASYHLKAD